MSVKEADAAAESLAETLAEIGRIGRSSQRAKLLKKIADAAYEALSDWEDDHCMVEERGNICGVSLDDGEGFDGKCGQHADEAEERGDYAHHD